MKNDRELDNENQGPYILRSEVDRAVKDLKKNKAPGEDKIDGEINKALGNKSKDNLYGIIKDSYKDGRLSKECDDRDTKEDENIYTYTIPCKPPRGRVAGGVRKPPIC
jgi:hypothetical protein